MTTRTFVGVAFLLCAMPFVTSAATAEELQAQIAALLARINALQQQLGTNPAGGTSGGVTNTPSVPAGGAVQCPHVSRVLKNGASGPDVSRLQQFLARDPSVYPEAQVTGYFGALTEKAVQRFQCKNKLVCDGTPDSTGYGVAGPRTAALMALQCAEVSSGSGSTTGSSGSVGGFIRVTPVTGNPPLVVSIEATVNTKRSCASASYEVDYGDNTPKTLIAVPANTCTELRQALSHTYTVPGAYTVTLRSGTQQTHATVTVGGSSGSGTPPATVDSLSGSPSSGSAPLTVSFRGTINASGSCNINSYLLDFGDGQTAPVAPNGCAPSLFSATHAYTRAGTYTAKLIRDAGGVQVGTMTVTVSGSSNDSSNNNSSYGSFFSVTPGVQGSVFTILAAFEIPSPCTAYQLNWGDSSAQVTQAQGTCSGGTVSKQFEHTYANGGTYTVTLRRGANLEESHSVGITISE